MIHRLLTDKLLESAKHFPVLAIVGPRQSGKTTLAKNVFEDYFYISLEDLDHREFAQKDPRGFLDSYVKKSGVIFDEIQNVPTLLSYIQTLVDQNNKPGHIVLTGSQNFLVNEAITQTLAGRISIHTLLPFSINELQQNMLLPERVDEILFHGCYPRVQAGGVPPSEWARNYIRTYVERDVRQIKNITDLSLFQRFIKLCAGRIGQLLSFSSLGNDCVGSPGTELEFAL